MTTGEGAFFKPHQDTPRGPDMFGSLVVVMPTPHEGGQLVLRHNDEEWTFDAAALLSGKAPNTLAYIAFFSDVEHEVLPVTSGYRVTLTYNLSYTWDRSTRLHREGVSSVWPEHADVNNLRRMLGGLLDDPEFLPEGGTLGFALRHGYPFPVLWDYSMTDPLKSLGRWLKGSDHSLYAACEELGLDPLLRLIYYGEEFDVLLDHMVELGDDDGGEGLTEHTLAGDGHGVVAESKQFEVSQDDSDNASEWESHREYAKIGIYWVTSTGPSDWIRSVRIRYGNEASIEHIYMYVCLIVEVAAASDRGIIGSAEAERGEEVEEPEEGGHEEMESEVPDNETEG